MVNNFRAVNSQQQQQSRRRRRPALRADDCEPLDTRTLEVAIRETAPRWRGQRNEKSAIGQAEITIKDLKAFHAAGLRGKQIAEAPALRVCDVSIKMLRAVVSQWLAKGLSPGSCHRRLSVLSVMGIDVRGARPPLGKALKWWLTPDLQADLTARLRSGALGCDDDEGEDCEDGLSVIVTPPMMAQEETPPITLQAGSFAFLQTIEAPPPIKERLTTASIDPILADFVDWTVWTGLRVEESLRLRRSSFANNFRSVTVPGLKTLGSQATLPISSDATALAKRIFAGSSGDPAMFPVTYRQLMRRWPVVMQAFGVTHPMATLKALRRSAARYLTVGGMPLDILRQYLRHNSVATTMGYLRLTGGYGENEMRRWLA